MSDTNNNGSTSKLNLLGALRILWYASPITFVLIAVLTVLSAVIPVLQVIVFASFVDSIIEIVSKPLSIATIAPSLFLIVLFVAYGWLSSIFIKLLWRKLTLRLGETYRVTLLYKCSRIQYFYYEDKDAQDCISRVMKDIEKNIVDVYENICDAFVLFINVIGVVFVIMAHSYQIAFLTLAVSILLMLLAWKSGVKAYKVNQEKAKFERRYKYLGDVLRNRESVFERTLFGYSRAINEKWKEAYGRSADLEQKSIRDIYIKGETGSILTALVSISSVAFLLVPVVQGSMSIGIYIALSNACFGLVGEISWTLRDVIERLAKQRGYIDDVNTLQSFSDKPGATAPLQEPMTFNSIKFENVSFCYPNHSQEILTNISFELISGKHYALVGKNGGGKSTIIKLLLGLYDSYDGHIYVDGIELREMDPVKVKSLFSAVFQDFTQYQISLRESIQLGSIDQLSGDEISSILQTLQLNELVDSLPQGLDTPLGRIMKESRDISGGQWQRVAIARCAVNHAPIRILDEPTAALDPMMESRLYQDFSKISNQKTTVLISHRLGSTKLADEILVLDHGMIVEQGDHDVLMAKKGLYYEMYENQRSWYI